MHGDNLECQPYTEPESERREKKGITRSRAQRSVHARDLGRDSSSPGTETGQYDLFHPYSSAWAAALNPCGSALNCSGEQRFAHPTCQAQVSVSRC